MTHRKEKKKSPANRAGTPYFDLKSVTWGYRDIFRKLIGKLETEEFLHLEGNTVNVFYELLNRAGDNSCFDQVVKNFLESLNSEHNWILKIPDLFSQWCALGTRFAEEKLYMGIRYFELWGRGGFGSGPEEVRFTLERAAYLLEKDKFLAYKFLESFRKLSASLSLDEIDVFIGYALKLNSRNPASSYIFMELKTKTSREYLKIISREARLAELKDRLELLMHSITGAKVSVSDFGGLDSDDLVERGSGMVYCRGCLYLPASCSAFRDADSNMKRYLSAAVLAASSMSAASFPLIHGAEGALTSLDFIINEKFVPADAPFVNNLFIAIELYRAIDFAFRTFPGSVPGLKRQIREELKHRNTDSPEQDFFSFMLASYMSRKKGADADSLKLLSLIKEAASSSANLFETLAFIRRVYREPGVSECIGRFFSFDFIPFSFFPDYMFPLKISSPPDSALLKDLRDSSDRKESKDRSGTEKDSDTEEDVSSEKQKEYLPSDSESEGDAAPDDKEKEKDEGNIGYFYHEWNEHEKDYFENWCCLNEKAVSASALKNRLSDEFLLLSRRIKSVFERLKPDLVRKKKFLSEGDFINIDRLTEFISMRKANIFAREQFYEKPFINKRDLAVALLIDTSGSTGEKVDTDGKTVIDLEKESAYILGEGLAELGDSFGIFGFTGNGRKNAEFRIFKDFDKDWNSDSKNALLSASPGSSTRIGVAVRHAGWKLSLQPSRKKIVILITDGKPMDSEYDPNTHYAQYDVRMANDENYRKGIDSFCISTEENKMEDLEIMFPFHRYVIIKNMKELPSLLSRLYLKLTK